MSRRHPRQHCEFNNKGALGLVLNIAVPWTTRCLDATVTARRALPAGARDVRDEDMAGRSPLRHAALNCLRRCSFRASILTGGSLRPVRDPAKSASKRAKRGTAGLHQPRAAGGVP
ncbi:hypothetical protein ABT173_45060 [Streptomyces sp. NPDC001795]|uniref:hypothetical protein n=1 Tax=Streptomyces sp. NPDC001795 TaxID=3154525 RepID=UPI0033211B32